jgi:hypothetical protein
MTVELLPDATAPHDHEPFQDLPVPSWDTFVLRCGSVTAEPDCPYCSGPESD